MKTTYTCAIRREQTRRRRVCNTVLTLLLLVPFCMAQQNGSQIVGTKPVALSRADRDKVIRTQWLTAHATTIDRTTNEVHFISTRGEPGVLSYDHLVIACGSVVDLSIIPGLRTSALPLKTLGDAVFFTNSLIEKMEEASMKTDSAERRRLLTFVIIGGGFSGVKWQEQSTTY